MCNHSAARVVEQSGGIESGRFREKYECPCGAIGFIRGDAGKPPATWTKTGEVFE